MNARFEKLLQLKSEYETKCKDEGESIIKEVLAEFFQKYPSVKAIQWEQYTPYFNDGDTCTFSVGKPSIAFSDIAFARKVLTESNLNKIDYEYRELPRDTRNPQSFNYYNRREYVETGRTPLNDDEILNDGGNNNDGFYCSYALRNHAQGIKDEVKALNYVLQECEDILLQCFGDHKRIVVNSGGSIDVEEYEHD